MLGNYATFGSVTVPAECVGPIQMTADDHPQHGRIWLRELNVTSAFARAQAESYIDFPTADSEAIASYAQSNGFVRFGEWWVPQACIGHLDTARPNKPTGTMVQLTFRNLGEYGINQRTLPLQIELKGQSAQDARQWQRGAIHANLSYLVMSGEKETAAAPAASPPTTGKRGKAHRKSAAKANTAAGQQAVA
jgi:hypothetical protein